MGMLDTILSSVTGQNQGGATAGSGVASSLVPALLAILAAKGGSGGLGNPGGMLGGGAGIPAQGQGGGLGGLLGGLLGGGTQGGGLGSLLGAGGVAGGLGQLLQTFQQNGYGNIANSWVGSGQNQAISPNQMTQALGPDTINQLANHTGLSQGDVASQLSQVLPQIVDRLTPQGRLPTHDEASQWV